MRTTTYLNCSIQRKKHLQLIIGTYSIWTYSAAVYDE